jgi:hypothetical protein
MTLTDKLIPYYVWFTYGFGFISNPIAIVNFGMLLITLITVKGIYVASWMIPVIVGLDIIACIAVGHYFEKYNIWNRITSHQNIKMNPQIKQMSDDITEIKKMLQERR